jgi:signal transduction histidine kinase
MTIPKAALILVWASNRPVDADLRGAADVLSIAVIKPEPRKLPQLVRSSVKTGSLVFVVADSPKQKRQALAAGARAALTVAELSQENSFPAAIGRAALRSGEHMRASPAKHCNLLSADAGCFDLFSESLALNLAGPLSDARFKSEALDRVLSIGTQKAGARRHAAVDARVESRAQRPQTMTSDLVVLLRNALSSVQKIQALVAGPPHGPVDARAVLWEIVGLTRARLERVGDFSVRITEEDCSVHYPRDQLVHLVGTLLAGAVLNAERKGGDRFVELALRRANQVALIEVRDDGDTTLGEVPKAWVPQFEAVQFREPGAAALALAAVRVRRAGGELRVDVQPGEGTTACVVLPLARSRRARRLS